MTTADSIDERGVLAAFADRDGAVEPLTAREVASVTGETTDAVRERLRSLTEQGYLASKRIDGRTEVWWRPPTSGTQSESAESSDVPVREYDSRTKVEQILEACPVSVVVVEPSGEISFANRRAEEMLGLDRTEITGRTYEHPGWEIYYEDGTPVPTDEHPVARVLETGDAVYGFEHWIRLSDGTERWLSSNSAPVVSDGEVEYVVVGFEDATPLKEREEKLTSEERRVLELSSERLSRPFLEAADGEFHVHVDEVVQCPDETELQYITASGIPPNRSRRLEQCSAVLDVRLLESVTDECRLELHVEGPTLPQVFDDLGGEITSLRREGPDQNPVLVGELPGSVPPRRAIQAAREVHPDIELQSQKLRYSPRLLYDAVEDVLTQRQFSALRTAYYGGHFDTPRRSTGDELADKLGITRQTFHHHLRKAERAVFHQLFESSPDTDTD